MNIKSIGHLQEAIRKHNYICDIDLITAIYLSLQLEKPLFLEGEPGVGKTEVAKVLSQIFKTNLIRLQCYEGLDSFNAIYEWNYSKQILSIKLHETTNSNISEMHDIFSEEFLIKRPLLQAIQAQEKVVLLIDELDRADSEFEAFLLEYLSDFQVSIPEVGTISANQIPIIIITSNRTRELHDAIKRRCLYHWINYPDFDQEFCILKSKIPNIEDHLTKQICKVMQDIRSRNFLKQPGIAETLDWAHALITLHKDCLDEDAVKLTKGCLLKYYDDQNKLRDNLSDILNVIDDNSIT